MVYQNYIIFTGIAFFQWQFHGAFIRDAKRKREIWEYFVDLQYVICIEELQSFLPLLRC